MAENRGQVNLSNRINNVVSVVIEQVNRQLPADRKIDKDGDTILVGPEGRLDSLGVVNLIVALQQAVEEEFGVELPLRLETAISRESTPFRSVGTLVSYLETELV